MQCLPYHNPIETHSKINMKRLRLLDPLQNHSEPKPFTVYSILLYFASMSRLPALGIGSCSRASHFQFSWLLRLQEQLWCNFQLHTSTYPSFTRGCPSFPDSSIHMLPFTSHLWRHSMVSPRMWKGMLPAVRWITTAPGWWRKGWPRERPGSLAEAELLSQLAVLLKPRTPIQELFRSYPSPEGWGGHYLEPDLSAYGVLKKDAALFVEYDGYWRHGEADGIANDERKNEALLAYAPPGSRVVRINQATSKSSEGDVFWITVGQWRSGDQDSLWRVLRYILQELLVELENSMSPPVAKRLRLKASTQSTTLSPRVQKFCSTAVAALGRNTTEEVSEFLVSEGFSQGDVELLQKKPLRIWSIERQLQPRLLWLLGFGLTKAEVAKVIAWFPELLACDLERNLKPKAQWFSDLGLTKCQFAKVMRDYPRVLGLSLQKNLRPTACWFIKLGLEKDQFVKMVSNHAKILGLSLQQNLRPTARWFYRLGLEKGQFAKMIAYQPRVLGLSIQQNVAPSVQWFLTLGLSNDQIAKCVASFPQLLGLNAEDNLRPKIQLLQMHFATQSVVEMIVNQPRILSYSQRRLRTRLETLARLGQKDKFTSAITLPDDRFQQRFCAAGFNAGVWSKKQAPLQRAARK